MKDLKHDHFYPCYLYEANILSIQTKSYIIPVPIASVVIAAAYLSRRLTFAELASLTKGIPISVLIAAIPPIEPAPNIAMYAKPRGMELMVDSTISSNAPLPAIP